MEVVETGVTKRIKCTIVFSKMYIQTQKCFIEEIYRVLYVNVYKL